MQHVLSEQDPKAVEKCRILENAMPADECERSRFYVKHVRAKEASLQLGVRGSVCVYKLSLIHRSKEPEMVHSASPCLGRALGAWVDQMFTKGLGGATEFAGKGFRQNHYRFAPLAATGRSAALHARKRWCLCDKGLQCATTK